MFTKMLVPLDGSEVSEGILPWVAHLCRDLGCGVVLMSVMDPGTPQLTHQITAPGYVRYMGRLPFLSYAADDQYYTGTAAEGARGDLPTSPSKYQYDFADHELRPGPEQDMVELEEWLRERASRLQSQGVNVLEETIVTARDKPSAAILQFAAARDCDCIAMATHDRSFLEQAFRGSVTNSVIRSSPVPVLAITPELQPESGAQPGAVSGLSVLLDGSSFAESVLPYVKHLARKTGLEVTLVRWMIASQPQPRPPGRASKAINSYANRESVEHEQAQATDEIADYLQGIAADLERAGPRVNWDIPGVALTSEAAQLPQKCAGSLMVLASHGRSGLSRWLEGSVAEDLLRNSGCPVLIIPSALAEEEVPDRTG